MDGVIFLQTLHCIHYYNIIIIIVRILSNIYKKVGNLLEEKPKIIFSKDNMDSN